MSVSSSSANSNKMLSLQKVVAGITTCQQSLQRQGMKLGSVSKNGNTFWGILRLLSQKGPMTVPQIAQHRKVSRQRIQVMMDEYVNEGFLEFTNNPSHKRSKLVNMTKKGQGEFTKLSAVIFNQLEQTAHEFDQDELQIAARVLGKLQGLLDET